SGCTVRNFIRFFSTRDFGHSLCDQRSRDAGAEKILVLVERAGLKHGEDKIAGELFLKILDDAFGSTGLQRLVFKTGELFFLTDVRAESDDLRLIVFLKPAKDNRSIEPTRICQNDFHFIAP